MTITVFGRSAPVSMSLKEGRELRFGRNRPDVHVCVGEDDVAVSREQGVISCSGGRWWLRNTGLRAIRVGEHRPVHRGDDPVPLPDGYTSVVVPGSGERVHLVEVLVAGPESWQRPVRHADRTSPARPWPLTLDERRALVILARRYLEGVESFPGPLSWKTAAESLSTLFPERGWTHRKVEHLVGGVRLRLSTAGVPGLVEAEVQQPGGDVLKRNLIDALLTSDTITAADLRIVDPDED